MIQHRATSRVNYLGHPVIPRLLGFQIAYHDRANGEAGLEGTEPPSILIVSRAWLACGPATFLITGVSNIVQAEA